MSASPSKTVSARVSQTVHSSIQAALQKDESISDFVLAAVSFELGKRRTKLASDISLADLGKLSQAAIAQTSANQIMLLKINTNLEKIMKELEIS